MAIVTDEKVYQIINKYGLIKPDVLDTALKTAQAQKLDFVSFLIDQELIKALEIGQLIANNLHVKYVNLAKENIKAEILTQLPEIVARKQKMLIFKRDAEGTHVAMADPFDYPMVKALEKKLGDKVIPYYSTEHELEEGLRLYKKSIQTEYVSNIQKNAIKAQGASKEDVSVIRLVDDIINYGFMNHASDIHIEPTEKEIVIRFRIDGLLYDIMNLPKNILDMIVTRVKILAKLRTDETRASQDGKIMTEVEGSKLDVRVSVLPIVHGEKIVMRLLSSQGKYFTLEELGMNEKDLTAINEAISKPYGMVLSTGPTGSGKTTTLYSLIKILNKRDINICTIEDPVEYSLDGVNQVQVNPATNLTFAAGLRSLLRQDPDIIMVGEIRDNETAGIAINSAMTGHLVLSTLHTNDAATALPRFLDMQIEPFLVASTVNIIIGQRLIRKICMKCIYSYTLSAQEIADIKREINIDKFVNTAQVKEIRLYRGKGCDACNHTGYTGRIGIFEVLKIEENIRELIVARADSDQLSKVAISNGMTTMLEDGFTKAFSGKTTIEEIFRVTKQ
ncbi:MAG: GspE/PulE family protein [Patescibacteria group bacterium]|jgi:type IV pilus assembly protein PilB